MEAYLKKKIFDKIHTMGGKKQKTKWKLWAVAVIVPFQAVP